MRSRDVVGLAVLVVALGPGLAAADRSTQPSPGDAVSASELSGAGRSARGVFVSALSLRTRGVDRVVASLRGARMTALVTDLKDERGSIVYETTHPLLVAQRSAEHGDLRSSVRALHDRGVYVIGRIVCFGDRALVRARPDLAVRDSRTGRLWRERPGLHWTSPYSAEVQDRLIAVAREAEAHGFDEVQLDYIRFPMGEGADRAVFPQAQQTPRHLVIARFLERLDAAIGIPISVDLFGLTAFHHGDPTGLGQSVEDLAPHVEALSPMLYEGRFDGISGEVPRRHRSALAVRAAVTRLVLRVGAGVAVRPYLLAPPSRDSARAASLVHAQVRAAQAAGASGALFWNRRSDYGSVYEAVRAFGPLFRPPSLPADARSIVP